MKIPINYRNREQTYVKHYLLRAYLERLFMIIGLHQSIIRYVDCFSGPWNEQDENLQDTSIGISLEIMKKCREGLSKMGKDVRFQSLFIEKDGRAFQKLETYLDECSTPEVAADARNGEFYDLREQILEWCGQDDFTFFFIDPKGWKKVVELSTLEPFLRRPNSEFLVNFMYDFLLRTHTQESFQEDMRAIFGSIPDTAGMAPKEKESHLIKRYRSHVKQIAPSRGGKVRTAHVPILYPLRDRTLYHLVYLTRHALGIVVFMEALEKLEIVQRQVRAKAKQENREMRTRQLELFDSSDYALGRMKADPEEVKIYLLQKFTDKKMTFGIEHLADMIEDTGWFESDFQAAFKDLFYQKILVNLDDGTGRRRKHHVNFKAHNNRGEELMRLRP